MVLHRAYREATDVERALWLQAFMTQMTRRKDSSKVDGTMFGSQEGFYQPGTTIKHERYDSSHCPTGQGPWCGSARMMFHQFCPYCGASWKEKGGI